MSEKKNSSVSGGCFGRQLACSVPVFQQIWQKTGRTRCSLRRLGAHILNLVSQNPLTEPQTSGTSLKTGFSAPDRRKLQIMSGVVSQPEPPAGPAG